MNTPINLNKARKARAKVQKRAQADENAVKFGRTKTQKNAEKRAEKAKIQHLDAHKRDP